MARSKVYTQLGMLFVGLLLTANIIGEKPLVLGPIILPAGLLLFPLTYLLAAALTEVYGFWEARRVIWMGMACNVLMALACRIAISLPAAAYWTRSDAYTEVLGISSRLMLVSVFTYCVGEFVNTYLVAHLKVRMQGRLFWVRALCGSWIGEGVETALFIPLAFWGTMPSDQLVELALFYYAYKVLYVFLAMPLLNQFVKFLKKYESEDVLEIEGVRRAL